MASNIRLHSFASIDPAQSLSQNIFWDRVWKAALIVSTLAFCVLGALTISLTTLYIPAHLPVVTIALIAGVAPAAGNVIMNIWKKGHSYRERGNFDRKLIQAAEKLPASTLNEKIEAKGFSSSAESSVKKNLLARFALLEQEESALRKEAQQKEVVTVEIRGKKREVKLADYQIAKIDFDNPDQTTVFEALQNHQIRRERWLHSAAICHLKAAHLLYLIQTPSDTRDLSDFVTLTTSNHYQHLLAKDSGDPTAGIIVKAGNHSFTKGEILARNTAELARDIFGLRLNSRFWW